MALTAAQLAALASEIRNDPAGLGYAAHLPGDPQRVVDLMAAQAYTALKPITAGQALTWAAAGPLASITDTSNNSTSPIRASCLAFLLAMNAGRDVDMSDTNVMGQFDIWLRVGLITQQAYDGLIALATQPASRADVLTISAPTARDIIDAWSSE